MKAAFDWFDHWKAKRATQAAEKKEAAGEAEGEGEDEGAQQVEEEGAGVVVGSEAAPEPMAETTAPKADAPAPLFNVGDIVIGNATKYKEKYDGQRCEVISVLSKHYKVKMLTGVEKNKQHKYLHASVKAAEKPEAPAAPAPQDVAPPPPEPEGDGAATPEPEQPAEGAVGDKASESEDIQELAQAVFHDWAVRGGSYQQH